MSNAQLGSNVTTKEAEEIKLIRPDVLDNPGILAGFSLRHGGVSSPPFHSLNLGLSTGDDEENVRENRRRLFSQLQLSTDHLAIAGQVHGSRVAEVHDAGLYPGFDALVTRSSNLVLCITSADCAVILLADLETRVIAACHSGWRGTAAEVGRRTVEAMQRLGANPVGMRAYVSPCISVDQFEVGAEVAAEFSRPYVIERSTWRRPHIDLTAAIGDQLVESGVPREAIEISPRCTYAETQDFFSFRAENGKTGRMMGFISLA